MTEATLENMIADTPASAARRRVAGLLLAVLLLSGAAGWGYLSLGEAADEASVAAADAAAARRAADRIAALRGRGGGGGAARPWRPEDLRGKIARAAGEGDLPEDALGTIDEQPPRRLAGSAYQERPTQVTLRGVTVPELVGFLYAVLEGAPGLRVTQVRLSAGPEAAAAARGDGVGGDGDPARWSAEATFSLVTPATDGMPTR